MGSVDLRATAPPSERGKHLLDDGGGLVQLLLADHQRRRQADDVAAGSKGREGAAGAAGRVCERGWARRVWRSVPGSRRFGPCCQRCWAVGCEGCVGCGLCVSRPSQAHTHTHRVWQTTAHRAHRCVGLVSSPSRISLRQMSHASTLAAGSTTIALSSPRPRTCGQATGVRGQGGGGAGCRGPAVCGAVGWGGVEPGARCQQAALRAPLLDPRARSHTHTHSPTGSAAS